MDPESKHLLEQTYALAKDNHRMLRAVRRHQIVGSLGTVIFWVIVILASGYSYLTYVQPLLDKLQIPGLSAIEPNSFVSTTTPIGKLINYFKVGK